MSLFLPLFVVLNFGMLLISVNLGKSYSVSKDLKALRRMPEG